LGKKGKSPVDRKGNRQATSEGLIYPGETNDGVEKKKEKKNHKTSSVTAKNGISYTQEGYPW